MNVRFQLFIQVYVHSLSIQSDSIIVLFSKTSAQVKLTKLGYVNVQFELISTDLNRAIVCRSFPPFKISWFHLPGFVVKFTNASLCIVAIGVNINRLATVIFDAFKLTLKLIGSIHCVYGMTK